MASVQDQIVDAVRAFVAEWNRHGLPDVAKLAPFKVKLQALLEELPKES